MATKGIQNCSMILDQNEPHTMSAVEWRDYLFKRIELLNKRTQQTGVTSWALLTALFVIFARFGTVITAKPSFDFVAIGSLFFCVTGMYYCLSSILNRLTRGGTLLPGLWVLKDVEKKGLALILLLKGALSISQFWFVIFVNYYSPTAPKVNSWILVLISVEIIIYVGVFSLLLSPLALVYSHSEPTKRGTCIQLATAAVLSVTPAYFGYFALLRLLTHGELQWFYAEVILLLSALWILANYLVRYKFERIPINEMETLLDDVVSTAITDNKEIVKRIQTILHGIDLEAWVSEKVGAAKKITSNFGRGIYELERLSEDVPDECRTCDHADEEKVCAELRRIKMVKKTSNDLAASFHEAQKNLWAAFVFPLFHASKEYMEQSGCFSSRSDIMEIILTLRKQRKQMLAEVKRQEKNYNSKLRELKAKKKLQK